MKIKFNRILSFILIIASFVSTFTIFSFTAGAAEDGMATELEVIYNRNYEEGWDFYNGFGASPESVGKNHDISIDSEILPNGDYNYFMRCETGPNGTADALLTTDFGAAIAKEDQFGTVFEMRLKFDDYAKDFGQVFYHQYGGMTIKNNTLYIKGNKLYFNYSNKEPFEVCTLTDEWMNLAIAFDWTKDDMTMTLYYGEFDEATHTYSQQYTFVEPYTKPGDKGILRCHFVVPFSTDKTKHGMGYCVDDYRVYNGSSVPVPVDANNKGASVNGIMEKTVEILENINSKTNEQVLQNALAMKVGVNYALVKNERQPIYDGTYGAPVKIDGEVRVPLELLLDYIGFPYYVHGSSYDITTGSSATYITMGRANATVAGNRIELSIAPGIVEVSENQKYATIGAKDIEVLFPGWVADYDEMGLLVVYEDTMRDKIVSDVEGLLEFAETDKEIDIINNYLNTLGRGIENFEAGYELSALLESYAGGKFGQLKFDVLENKSYLTEGPKPLVHRDSNLDLMLKLMKKFIFDVSASARKDDQIASGMSIYEDIKENTTVDKDGEKVAFSHPYLVANQSTFDRLKADYNGSNATLKGYIESVVGEAEELYNEIAETNGDGYAGIKANKVPVDVNNGYSSLEGRIENLTEFTGNILPLAFAYQITGEEKYALLAYDYMTAIASFGHWGPAYMVDCAEATLHFALGYDWLYNGFVSLGKDVDALATAIYEKGVRHGYNSSSGIVCEEVRPLGDLSAYTTRDDHWNTVGSAGMIIGAMALMDKAEYLDQIFFLVGNNLANLASLGLDLYAPDGAYTESATNWSYATNYLFYLLMSLESASGTTYGIENTWGLDKTCYYALHIESSDGKIWNYHDGGFDGINGPLAGMETQCFNYAGKLFGDQALVSVRADQLSSGRKEVSMFDLFFYPYDGVVETFEPPLNYYMTGLEAYVTRSDWSEGALYAGIMGGRNDANFGQLDSGNFIYHNKGVVWFMDLGSENTAVFEYYGSKRYQYYRTTTEGQNVIYMTDSQGLTGELPFGQERSAGGVITKTFENENGNYAILDNTDVYLTATSKASRGIMVMNDNKTTVIQDEIYFKGGLRSARWVAHTAQDILLDSDGKTAWLKNVTNGTTTWLRASIVSPVDIYSFNVIGADSLTLDNTFGPKDSVSNGGAQEYSRNKIQRLIIESNNTTSFFVAVVLEVVSGIDDETPVGYTWSNMNQWTLSGETNEVVEEAEKRYPANKADISSSIGKISNLFNKKIAFTKELPALYESLTLAAYTFKTYTPDSNASVAEYYIEYLNYRKQYEDYAKYIEANTSSITKIASVFSGQ